MRPAGEYAKGDRPRHGQVQGRGDSHKFRRPDRADTKQGSSLGVQGTPASFVNGHFINGAQPFDAFKKIADEELAKGAATKGKKKVAAAIK